MILTSVSVRLTPPNIPPPTNAEFPVMLVLEIISSKVAYIPPPLLAEVLPDMVAFFIVVASSPTSHIPPPSPPLATLLVILPPVMFSVHSTSGLLL